jgi:hypothetical protein
VSEDFASDVEGLGRQGEIELSRELGRGTTVFLAVDWRRTDVDGDLDSFETGFFFADPSLPYERTTLGALDGRSRELAGGGGVAFELSGGAELELRYTRVLEREEGELTRTQVLDEFMGDPPSVSTFVDENDYESALDLFELEASAPLGERVRLDVALAWGREDLDVRQVVEDIVIRRFDGAESQAGGELGIGLELGRGWDAELGAGHEIRPTESAEPGVLFAFEDDRRSFVRARCNHRGAARALTAEGRVERRESDALTSEGEFSRLALSYGGALGSRTSFATSVSLARQDLESESTIPVRDPFGTLIVVPFVARFDGHQVGVGASVERAVGELRPRIAWNGAFGRGDGAFDYQGVTAALPWVLDAGFELGVALRYLDFDGEGLLDASDYDALVLEVYVRRGFGVPPR